MIRSFFKYLFPCIFLILLSCQQNSPEEELRMKAVQKDGAGNDEKGGSAVDSLPPPSCALEERIREAGLVPVKRAVEGIRVDLKYSSTDNFLGKDLYGELETCYVHPDLAEKLELARLFLQNRYPNYELLVFDGVRPLSVQRRMWKELDIPVSEKRKFLASPDQRSLHNYGVAVDLSICNEYGDPLDMGTPYDHRGVKAYPRKEEKLLEEGSLTEQQVENRRLLRSIMEKAGFRGISTEWWHFSIASHREARQKYQLVK